MAEMLVEWADRGIGDNLPKRFDVGVVAPDGHVWGNLEGFPTYLRISLPGIPESQVDFLMQYEGDPNGYEDIDTPGRFMEPLTFRAWHVVESRLNPPILNALEAAYLANEKYVVNNAEGMLAWLEKKIDNGSKSKWGLDHEASASVLLSIEATDRTE